MAKPYRILAIDGGRFGLLGVLMLKYLERARPGFLSQVDMIAGTSAGALTGLLLAREQNPALMLGEAEYFWRTSADFMRNDALGYIRALVGLGALYSNRQLRAELRQPQLLGTLTLGQLAKAVTILAFRVNPRLDGHHKWHPVIYDNFGTADSEDDLLAADVGMQSSAAPVEMPVYQGSIDGGVFANNPTMVAIAQLMHASRAMAATPAESAGAPAGSVTPRRVLPLSETSDAGRVAHVHDVYALSIGFDARQRLDVWNGDWGYGQWLFNPRYLFAIAGLLWESGSEGAVFESSAVLPPGHLLRLNVRAQPTPSHPALRDHPRLAREAVAMPVNRSQVQAAVSWLDSVPWFD